MLTRRLLLLSTAIGFAALPAISGLACAAEPVATARTDADWRRLLTPAQYAVLRRSDTEPAFSSPLLKEHRLGTFACAGCDLGLFSSDTKFESGTGWPSFWMPLDKAVGTTEDTAFGTIRRAVYCAGCRGHLGHVFEDGPKPTGLRYCMNGVALRFRPAG